jgi:hypothetical protein
VLAGGLAVPLAPVGAAAPKVAGHVAFAGSPAPAFAGDAPDPDIVQAGGAYYAFTTGTALGNHLQALVDTSGSPASGWRSYTGTGFGSTALPSPPAWEQPNTQTSPGVFAYGGHWVMFYDASLAGHAEDSGFSCLSVATAPSLSPTSPVFADASAGPLTCGTPGVGVLDPSPFVDPATGAAYLVWKSNDGSSSAPSQVWVARLDATGTAIVGAPTVLLTVDQATLPWETTTDDPQLVFASGTYDLLFSAGNFEDASYDEALATCSSPVGSCTQPAGPFLTSYGGADGPGGGSLYQDAAGNWWLAYAAWAQSCGGSCGGDVRELYTAPIDLSNGLVVPCQPPAGPAGYRLVASDGGIFNFGDLPFCGSTGAISLNQPVVGMAATADGGGYWTVARDGGIFAFGDAGFFGSTGAIRLNQPVVGMAATPDDRGYWLVAADGGLFAFGDAGFFGSTGAMPLNQPVVGMAATPDGRGYWLVARDGGLFAFGDAGFFGSTGAMPLNQPVVGMAATPDGRGYWLVARDGGLFAFGDAGFFGSTGAMPLNQPVVGMAATPDGRGYWLVASDGGIFAFGDAPFDGSTGAIHLNRPVVGMSGP